MSFRKSLSQLMSRVEWTTSVKPAGLDDESEAKEPAIDVVNSQLGPLLQCSTDQDGEEKLAELKEDKEIPVDDSVVRNLGKATFARYGPIVVSEARKEELSRSSAPATKTKLDAKTLKILKEYISGASILTESTLDEVDIVELCEITSKYTIEKKSFPTLGSCVTGGGLGNAVDSHHDTGLVDEESYNREQFHVLGMEFFKCESYEANVAKLLTTGKRRRKSPMMAKTVGWLKKASSIERPYCASDHPHVQIQLSGEEGTAALKASNGRVTRRMIKSNKDRKKEELIRQDNQGLEALLDGIKTLEHEGKKEFEKSKRFVHLFVSSDEEDSESNNMRSSRKRTRGNSNKKGETSDEEDESSELEGDIVRPGKVLVAKLSTTGQEMTISKLLVYGRHESGATETELDEWRRERKKRHNREYYLHRKRQRDQASAKNRRQKKKKDTPKSPPLKRKRKHTARRSGLSMFGVDGHMQEGPVGTSSVLLNSDEDPRISKSSRKPKPRRRPKKKAKKTPSGDRTAMSFKESKRMKPSSRKWVAPFEESYELMNFLEGKGRQWARHEFFYGDVDRAFFSSNEFLGDVTKLGMQSSLEGLKKHDRGLLRSQVARIARGRQRRRFSRAFIDSEIKKRNRYREMYRKTLASNEQHGGENENGDVPGETAPKPKTIEIGGEVTAFCKKEEVLIKGTVLSYTSSTGEYVVDFEKHEIGKEICPDFEVSACRNTGRGSLFSTIDPRRNTRYEQKIGTDVKLPHPARLLNATKKTDMELPHPAKLDTTKKTFFGSEKASSPPGALAKTSLASTEKPALSPDTPTALELTKRSALNDRSTVTSTQRLPVEAKDGKAPAKDSHQTNASSPFGSSRGLQGRQAVVELQSTTLGSMAPGINPNQSCGLSPGGHPPPLSTPNLLNPLTAPTSNDPMSRASPMALAGSAPVGSLLPHQLATANPANKGELVTPSPRETQGRPELAKPSTITILSSRATAAPTVDSPDVATPSAGVASKQRATEATPKSDTPGTAVGVAAFPNMEGVLGTEAALANLQTIPSTVNRTTAASSQHPSQSGDQNLKTVPRSPDKKDDSPSAAA